MIEYQLPSGIMKYSKCLSYPPPIPSYVIQIINPFLNSTISANGEIRTIGIVSLC